MTKLTLLKKILALLKKNKVLVFAILIGFVYLLPHICLWIDIKNNDPNGNYIYEPVAGSFDSAVYGARIKQILEGNPPFESYIFEQNNKTYFFPFFQEAIFAGIAFLFFGNIVTTYIFTSFLFAFLLFILLYIIFKKIFKKENLALVLSTTILLATPVSFIFIRLTNSLPDILRYSRIINPSISALLFFLAIYFFIEYVNKQNKKYILLSGLFLGTLFYSYLYAWTFFVGFIILYILMNLYETRKVFSKQNIGLIFIIIIGLILAIPYFINNAMLLKEYGYEIYEKAGITSVNFSLYLIEDNVPVNYFVYLLIIISIIFLTYLALLEKNKILKDKKLSLPLKFLICLFFSGFVCYFFPYLVLREQMFPDHWLRFAIWPTFLILSVYTIITFISRSHNLKKHYKLIFCLLIAYLFINSITTVILVSKDIYPQYEIKKTEINAFDWMSKNIIDKNCAILTFNGAYSLIALHTNCYTFVSDYTSKASIEELTNRQEIMFAIFNVSDNIIINYFLNESYTFPNATKIRSPDQMTIGALYDPITKIRYNLEGTLIPIKLANEIISNITMYKQEDMCTLLTKYKLDYIYVGADEQLIINRNLDKDIHFEKVYDDNNIKIYKVNKEYCAN